MHLVKWVLSIQQRPPTSEKHAKYLFTVITSYALCYRKGSVVVDFFLWVDSTLSNRDVLQDILVNVPFSIGGHAVDLKSVKLSSKTNLNWASLKRQSFLLKTCIMFVI